MAYYSFIRIADRLLRACLQAASLAMKWVVGRASLCQFLLPPSADKLRQKSEKTDGPKRWQGA